MKMVFLSYYKQPQRHHLWFYTDLIVSVSNFIGLAFISRLSATDILNSKTKANYDYAVVVIVVVAWFRWFNYFLLSNKMSKLLVTLLQMVFDTMSFTFILALVLFIFASAFTMRFSNLDPDF